MKVTRIIQVPTPEQIQGICKVAAFLRADIWRRFGALKNVGKSNLDIRKEISKASYYNGLEIDGTIRNETTKDVINDILLYKAAAKEKVRKAICVRTDNPEERKRLFTLLKRDEWLKDSFLHRQMRKHFKHGVAHADNQFIVRSDRYLVSHEQNRLVITIRIAKQYGGNIKLVTTTNGKNVHLGKCNLRIICKGDMTEIHYCTEKQPGRPHGEHEVGVDKGYTEAFAASNGNFHGAGFGDIMSEYSDKAAKIGKARNKLHALERKHREAGRIKKADNLRKNNLSAKKITARREKYQKRLENIVFKAVHSIVDKAAVVVSEDLTSPIAKKKPWKKYNRRMSAWAKGLLAKALETVCQQRGANHFLVAAAYTSQMDSATGLLEGKRIGDKFYRANGDVLQADLNASRNVLARLHDPEITRYMSHQKIKQILLSRSPAELTVNRLELETSVCQPSADNS